MVCVIFAARPLTPGTQQAGRMRLALTGPPMASIAAKGQPPRLMRGENNVCRLDIAGHGVAVCNTAVWGTWVARRSANTPAAGKTAHGRLLWYCRTSWRYAPTALRGGNVLLCWVFSCQGAAQRALSKVIQNRLKNLAVFACKRGQQSEKQIRLVRTQPFRLADTFKCDGNASAVSPHLGDDGIFQR